MNGFIGVTEALIIPVSRGRRLVSHYGNVNAVDGFYPVDDGDVKLYFEPLFPNQRHGSDPDCLLDPMRDVGFDVTDTLWRGSVGSDRQTEAAFDLAERLTGRHGHAQAAAQQRIPGRLGKRLDRLTPVINRHRSIHLPARTLS